MLHDLAHTLGMGSQPWRTQTRRDRDSLYFGDMRTGMPPAGATALTADLAHLEHWAASTGDDLMETTPNWRTAGRTRLMLGALKNFTRAYTGRPSAVDLVTTVELNPTRFGYAIGYTSALNGQLRTGQITEGLLLSVRKP